MRQIPGPIAPDVTQQLGSEPIVVIEIDWSSGTGYYADREITILGQAYLPRVISIDQVATLAKAESLGTISVSSVTLSDIAGDLRTILNTQVVETRPVRIYHAYAGGKLLVLDGNIAGGISWDQGTKTLTIGIETPIRDAVFGYEDWPIVFGDCLRVPAKRFIGYTEGDLTTTLTVSYTSTTGSFRVVGGRDFPQATPLKIRIATPNTNPLRTGPIEYFNAPIARNFWPSYEHWYMDGSFDGEIFTATRMVASKYDAPIELDNPDTLDPDYSATRTQVVWLKNDERIVGMYVSYKAGPNVVAVNFCTKQVGKKCWFYRAWWRETGGYMSPSALNLGYSFDECCILPPARWDYLFQMLYPQWDTSTMTIVTRNSGMIPLAISYRENKVQTTDFGTGLVWVANLYPSTEVVEVIGKRKLDQSDRESIFAPIPSSYYNINLSDSLAGHTPTTISMFMLLSDREREGWEDEIYVSLRSTLSKNTAVAIKHILDTYTDLATDTTTFSNVQDDVANYPSNFVVYGEQEVTALVQRIAYQARCALLQQGSSVKIKYLSKATVATRTYAAGDVIFRSFQERYTQTNEIRTQHEITWVRDHSLEDKEEFLYHKNVDLFGTYEHTEEWLIYNIKSLVEKSAAFWGYRKGSSWRHAAFQTILTALDVEGYDTNAVNLPFYIDASLRGTVESITLDEASAAIGVDLEIACVSGSTVEDPNYWSGDPSYPISGSDTMPEDPLIDRALVDYIPNQWPLPPEPETELGLYVLFSEWPDSISRGVAAPYVVRLYNKEGNRYPGPYTLTLSLNSTSPADVISPETITIDENGEWSGNLTVSGGSGTARAIVNILSLREAFDNALIITGTASEQISIDPTGEVKFQIGPPDLVVRDGNFYVKLHQGGAATSVTVELVGGDPLDKLYNESGEVTTIGLSIEGGYEDSWYISGGSENPTSVTIRLTEGTWQHESKIITVTGPYIVRDENEMWNLKGYPLVWTLPPDRWVAWSLDGGVDLLLHESDGPDIIRYEPNAIAADRVLRFMGSVSIRDGLVIFEDPGFALPALPAADPEEAGWLWQHNGFVMTSGSEAKYSNLLGAASAIKPIGEIWTRNNDHEWSVQIPGNMSLVDGVYHPTALSFICNASDGLDVVMARNAWPDPPEGIKNIDDIEIILKLAAIPEARVLGRAVGDGAGIPYPLTAAQINAITGGGGGGDVEEAPVNGTTYGRKDAAWQALATVATTGSYASLSNIPATFAPTQHAIFGSSHSGFTLTSLAADHGLVYNGTTWVNQPLITRDTNGLWTIGKSAEEVFELLSGSDVIFRNRSGTTVSAATNGSSVGWAYSATRYVTLGYYSGNVVLGDGTSSGLDGDNAITYKPNAANASRELELKVKTTWKGTSADLVIDGTLLNAAGKAMAIREIDVCVDGVAKKMLVLASAPY